MNLCPICGREVPPSAGQKPRFYDTDLCRNLASQIAQVERGMTQLKTVITPAARLEMRSRLWRITNEINGSNRTKQENIE